MLQSSTNGASGLRAVAIDGAVKDAVGSTEGTRFGTYFPRVFACAYSLTGDEAVAKDIVSEAFSHVLAHSKVLSEEEFVVELFSTARDLARASRAVGRTGGNLTGREKELLAFLFDARLTHEEIRRLMRTTERALSAALLRALRKLQSGMTPAAAASLRSG
jgi:DNA-directed RNA polymerase specialized sigma24 family protein